MEIGFARSRLVILNEAHDGARRCVRTREVGRRVLPVAHRAGVRYLAMEALAPLTLAEEANRDRRLPPVEHGYLAQPEMRALVQDALDLGWTLLAYEAGLRRAPPDLPPLSLAFANWREEEQARTLAEVVADLPADARLLVWCGHHHQLKTPVPAPRGSVADWLGRVPPAEWLPMGWHLVRLGLDPFVIDQAITVRFRGAPRRRARRDLAAAAPGLARLGGTAGFLVDEAPPAWARPGVDAVLLSLHNDLE